MGGGDLNLKKSWHPQTLRNVERVWKAEQKATAEAKKIEQLQRELKEERAREEMQRHAVDQGIARKKSERLDWMYSTPGQVDREQYLLGKAIDKHVDPLANDDQQNNTIPGASFSSDANANTPADLAAKVRDDPLFLIKKKEEEKKKELIKNPIKMKQLRQMLEANLTKSKKKKDKKKRKKERKEKKRRNKETESEESDSDDEPRKSDHKDKRYEQDQYRYSAIEKHSQIKSKERYRSESLERLDRDDESRRCRERPRKDAKQLKSHSRRSRSRSPVNRREQREKKRHRQRSSSRSISSDRQRSRSSSPIRNGHLNTKTGSHKSSKSSNRRSFSPSLAKKSRRSPSPKQSRYSMESPTKKARRSPSPRESSPMNSKSRRSPLPKLVRQHRESSPVKSRRSQSPRRDRPHRESPPRKSRRSPSPKKSLRSPSPKQIRSSRGSAVTKKMSAEELEKRREEMLENAKWRNDQRTTNVKKYREKEEAEAKEEAQGSGKSAKFISSMKVDSFSSKTTASVADRIKRNINSLQRTKADLDTFLVKKWKKKS